MKKLVLVNGIVLLCLLAVSLLCAELWLRSTIPAEFQGESILEYTLSTPRYVVMKRNARVLAWGKELRTNELGFRDDKDVIPPKEAGEFRIVVLGDSFTVSAGVEYRDTFTSVLEAQLRKQRPKTRVINLAVSGYNPVQYALVLDEVGLSLKPDLIVVGLFPENDFTNSHHEAAWAIASGRQSDVTGQVWYERMYVYRAYLRPVIYRLTRVWSRAVGQGVPQPGKGGEESSKGWRDNVAALRQISNVAGQRNIPLVIAVLPGTRLLERQRPLFARMDALCAENRFVCVDLLEKLIAGGGNEMRLYLNALDAHSNENYNRVVGTALSAFIESVEPERVGPVNPPPARAPVQR
jgi:lysophospholipase L1-like esterase